MRYSQRRLSRQECVRSVGAGLISCGKRLTARYLNYLDAGDLLLIPYLSNKTKRMGYLSRDDENVMF
jgi:hypothetical protein